VRRCRDCGTRHLGPCQDYCYDERQGLIEWVQEHCAALGHELGPFKQIPGYAVWAARCTLCGRLATVRLDPDEGEQAVESEAFKIICIASEDETPS
jgi:hypothetical protein